MSGNREGRKRGREKDAADSEEAARTQCKGGKEEGGDSA